MYFSFIIEISLYIKMSSFITFKSKATANQILSSRFRVKDETLKSSQSCKKLSFHPRHQKQSFESTTVLKIYNEIPSLQSKTGSLSTFLDPNEFTRCANSLPESLKLRSLVSRSLPSLPPTKHKLYITMNEVLSNVAVKDPAATLTDGVEEIREHLEDPTQMLLYDIHAINRRRAATMIRDNIVEEIKGGRESESDEETPNMTDMSDGSPKRLKLPSLKKQVSAYGSLGEKLDSVISMTSKILNRIPTDAPIYRKKTIKDVNKSEIEEGNSFESMVLKLSRSWDKGPKEEKVLNGDFEDLLKLVNSKSSPQIYITQTILKKVQGLKSIHKRATFIQMPVMQQELVKLTQDKIEILPKSIMRKRVGFI